MDQQRYLIAGSLFLDRQDERLWQNGREVRLGGKAWAMLRTLMEKPRTLVTKDELFERVWPGLAVSESVLTTAAKEVRQAIGDDARNPTIIQTVYGRGYRFLVDTVESNEPPAAPSRGLKGITAKIDRRHLMAGFAALLLLVAAVVAVAVLRPSSRGPGPMAEVVASHPKSIAVLPFEDLSADSDQQWFAAGLTEEILNSLARTPDLRVAARTSTRSVGSEDVRQIGRRLNVAHILEGSVRRDRDRIRVTAQLIRTSDGFHLWSQNYDRPASDVVSIQEDIAIAIAQALKTVMSPERLQAMVSLGTRSVEAYEEYLKGLAYEEQGLVTGADQNAQLAFEAYERARTIDPSFAAAQWEAAQDWFGNTTRVGSTVTESRGTEEQRLKEYLVRVDAAIASSRGRPEQFRYRSARALMDLRFREALRLMLTYLNERPRDIDAWDETVNLAGYVEDRGLMLKAAERIHTISMESGSPRSRAITAAVFSSNYPFAVKLARQQLKRSPGEALIQYQSHRALLSGGYRDEARQVLDQLRNSKLPEESKLIAELRQICADGAPGAREIAARIATLPDSTSTTWQAYVLLSEPARATATLAPLHRTDRLATLMQYLVYPSFDVRPFPLLQARLTADGIRRPPPVPIPFACKASASSGAR
ncbi:MAG TPA: winged helix-turn-helix domain-containing protein [Sphingomicrobium sp.]|nr:winged helix-turn-helix domain-containing protein [Sphingomicrobium sp.]